MDESVDTDNDVVLAELKKLREGRGLTIERLSKATAVLKMLGTSDPAEARDLIERQFQLLGDGERIRALRVDCRWTGEHPPSTSW